MEIEDYRKTIDTIQKQIGDVKLMAVSKTRSMDEIMAAYEAGARLFGENHVQEIVEKFSGPRPEGMKVHMIGHLQSNKVNKVVPLVDMIQSVDSLALLQKIDNAAGRCGKVMDVLLEVNTSQEEAKSGFETQKDLTEALEASKAMKNVRIRGLMTIGPVDCEPDRKDELTDQAFRQLVAIRKKCMQDFPGIDFSEMSMGMSSDYLIGVRNGSTMVRIGTAIFGARDYSKVKGSPAQ